MKQLLKILILLIRIETKVEGVINDIIYSKFIIILTESSKKNFMLSNVCFIFYFTSLMMNSGIAVMVPSFQRRVYICFLPLWYFPLPSLSCSHGQRMLDLVEKMR